MKIRMTRIKVGGRKTSFDLSAEDMEDLHTVRRIMSAAYGHRISLQRALSQALRHGAERVRERHGSEEEAEDRHYEELSEINRWEAREAGEEWAQ